MKRELNAAIRGRKLGEVMLFREMADHFNAPGRCTYAEEVHGNKGWVEFRSLFSLKPKTVELGDLLLFTYDEHKRELRICTMQAKYKKERLRKFLHCRGDVSQWELLYSKPTVKNKNGGHFPPHILNFRKDYDSITAYGVFYHDRNHHEIDFLYTLPYYFRPAKFPRAPISNGSRAFQFTCPIGADGSMTSCTAGIDAHEAFSTCSIDVFEDQVLRCRVGAPIEKNSEIQKWALNFFAHLRARADHPEVVDTVLRAYDFIPHEPVSSGSEHFDSSPAALIVVTNTKQYEESCGMRFLNNTLMNDRSDYENRFG